MDACKFLDLYNEFWVNFGEGNLSTAKSKLEELLMFLDTLNNERCPGIGVHGTFLNFALKPFTDFLKKGIFDEDPLLNTQVYRDCIIKSALDRVVEELKNYKNI